MVKWKLTLSFKNDVWILGIRDVAVTFTTFEINSTPLEATPYYILCNGAATVMLTKSERNQIITQYLKQLTTLVKSSKVVRIQANVA